jgi:hypothetical protein
MIAPQHPSPLVGEGPRSGEGGLTVACVLRSGGEYTPVHVEALRAGVAAHLKAPHRFVCLTDMKVACETIALEQDWPGWWSKIELFRPGIFAGPVFYADLDTIVTGPLDELVRGHEFTVLRNFWKPDRIGSGLMAWDADLSRIYYAFRCNPDRFIRDYKTPERWGDQSFIKDHSTFEPERWQAKYPGKIVSYKFHVRDAGRVPPGAAVVCFHGQPRPWATNLWKKAA